MTNFAQLPQQKNSDIIDLYELLAKLHRNDPITPSLVTTIAIHASKLSESICADYKTLNSIIVRHESTIRKRWLKKSGDQRMHLLLAAWPDISVVHRPDYIELTKTLANSPQPIKDTMAIKDKNLPSDAKTWPYINIEDLTRSKCLLIFLNARGRNVPRVFALTETEFSPLAKMSACRSQPELAKYMLRFTVEPNSSEYGMVSPVDKKLEIHVPYENGYESCPRPGLQVLQIQQRILSFLVSCSKLILHDMTEDVLLNSAVQNEPPSSDLEIRNDMGHTTFADALMIAPYRNRGAIDFLRLRGYVSALYTNAKDHIWALREDPAYFADTFMSISDHGIELIADPKGRMHPKLDTTKYVKDAIIDVISEAYTLFFIWRELDLVLDKLEKSSKDKRDAYFSSLMAELDCRSRAAYKILGRMIRLSAASAPNMRKCYLREETASSSRISLSIREELSLGELQLVECLSFDLVESAEYKDGPIYYLMDHIDTILLHSKRAREMLSPLLYELIAQMSVVVECIFQPSIWYNTPQAQGIDMHAKHSHEDFEWLKHLGVMNLPVHLINPARGKLNYPIHKTRNRSNVQALRSAEANLDKFWEHIDTYFEKRTGIPQHEIIRQCVLEGGQMQRTPPWEELDPATSKPSDKPEYVYQPLSRIYHNEAMQITGSFDKLSIQEKVKQKTKGTVAGITVEHMPNIAAAPNSDEAQNSFLLDKRSYKAMKALFHVASSDKEELPKAIKWDEFKRAMVRIGFSAEKLQGSAWQFTPGDSLDIDRAIQFHEPHPNSDIPWLMGRRFGRRLQRVYGWNGDSFKLK